MSATATSRNWLRAHPQALALGLYALLAVVAGAAAYFAIFTQFSSGDDEGTLLVSLNAFAHGQHLYSDVYSPYGPFYYELFGGFFSLTGLAVTNDASRLVVIVVWVGASCLYGVSAQRLTGSLLLGLSGMIVAFAVLGVLVNEPMHPHGLCVLLLAALTLLLASGPPKRVALAGGAAGALLAALVLTKVNLGGLAIAAIALAAVLTIEPLYRRRWLRWPVVIAFLLLPTALMARELRAEWTLDLIGLELLATLALLVAATRLRPAAGDWEGSLRWIAAATAGFAAAFVAIVLVLVLAGSGLGDLYDGAVVQGFKIGDVFVLPFVSPVAALEWGIAAAALAVIVVWGRFGEPAQPSPWPGLLRVAAGLAIWLTIARTAPFSLGPASNQEALPLVLAWIAVLAPAGVEEHPYRRFLRLALAALCLTETLQVYPVAGSQVGIAAASFVAVGAICLGDGLGELRRWSAARGELSLQRFGFVGAVLMVALAGKMAVDAIVRPGVSKAVLYGEQQALPFSGAGLLRLPADQATEYAQLVALLREHRCTTFIGYPNVNGLYLWSSIEPPPPSAPGAWVTVLDSGRQQRIVDEVGASPRPCALRKDPLANAWLQNAPPPRTPLVEYIFNDFEQVGTVAEWQFLVPKGTRS